MKEKGRFGTFLLLAVVVMWMPCRTSGASRISTFSDARLTDVRHVLMDEARGKVVVGARDALLSLGTRDLALKEDVDWSASADTVRACRKEGQSQETCHNYVRVLLAAGPDKILTCGTNAFAPTCIWRKADKLASVVRTFDGRGVCPFSPRTNASALVTPAGLYAATVNDKIGRDAAINRQDPKGRAIVRTARQNSHWLDDPNFVSMFEIGNFVYTFFRETATEHINCGKTVFSRAARVCKNDQGGLGVMRGEWTSFRKARLNCSRPGDFPFYFDELQDAVLDEKSKVVYAVFTTPRNAIAGSAVCAYSVKNFEDAFSGPFRHSENSRSLWLPYNHGQPQKQTCGDIRRNMTALEEAYKLQLMDRAVQPDTGRPLAVSEHVRWTRLVVDRQRRGVVVHVASEAGRLHTLARLRDGTLCTTSVTSLVQGGRPRVVTAMALSKKQSALFVTVEGQVLRVPVQRNRRLPATARNCPRIKESSRC